jgi:LPS-assembly protein
MQSPAKRSLLTLVVAALIASALGIPVHAQSKQPPQNPPPATEPENPPVADPQEPAPADSRPERRRREGSSDEVVIEARDQETVGDVTTYTGYVDLTYQNIRLQADRVEYNETTNGAVAEGNVIFDQGADQRVTARRAELNVATKRGTFYTVTGFTDRTATGEFLYYTATRVDKVAADEYILFDAEVTACEDAVPKWSFKARKAMLKVNDRVRLRNAVFEIKDTPVFYLPFATVPINQRERQSGFLLPRFGNSNTKGFTFSQAYYQTLGRSADVLLRGDIFTARGVGFGMEFRARTDERSGIQLGTYIVKDRLFGDPGPDQGGSAFFMQGVQYLPHGWLAVADVRVTSNLDFRRTFSDSFEEIINPEERSTLYFNNNYDRYSFNFLTESDSTNIRQDDLDRDTSSNFNVNVRHLPSFELTAYDRPIKEGWPIYFSFDAAVDGLRRRERVGETTTFSTPSLVQRLDFQPRFTFPLPIDLGGWAITPAVALRATFYSNSLNPEARRFNPRFFTLDPNDPRLNPDNNPTGPPIVLFDPLNPVLVLGDNVSRGYTEVTVDVRPPAFAKLFSRDDETPYLKHVIEPYAIYRLIAGVSNFERIPRFDERDAVANTNEIEYGIVNRFFVQRGARKSRDGDDGDEERSGQPHELLSIAVRQKYYFDPTFGDAFDPLLRNQFYPINQLSGFGAGGIERRFSPINVEARLRPLSALFADVRFDYDVQRNGFKDAAFSGGARGDRWSVSQTWFFNRRFRALRGRVEPGTFAGNQWITAFSLGDQKKGVYGGTRLNIDFTDRIDATDLADGISDRRLLNTRSYLGYSWDCCGVQANYATFNLPSGLRRESQLFITFTLAGIGSLGNQNVGQPAQTRRIARSRAGRNDQPDLPEDQ